MTEELNALKLAFLNKEKSDLKHLVDANPIAVVGMGCRFPGKSNSIDEFWKLILSGNTGRVKIPKDRFDVDRLLGKSSEPGKISTMYAHLVDRYLEFDHTFFKISAHEAKKMDPQQRVLLEVVIDALQNYGTTFENLRGSNTGIFIGASTFDYAGLDRDGNDSFDAYMSTGNSHAIISNRISYFLDLKGPSLTLDTACSSSLTAIHYASESLRKNDCNLAIAGGVQLILGSETMISLSRFNMLSSDGLCKPFDSKADGFARGEGAGVVILKRLVDAIKDGDHIWSVIRSSALNQDGASNGLTAPNSKAQAAVIQEALKKSFIDNNSIEYIETHGTGTALGDPIEIEGLAYGYNGTKSNKKYLGAVKGSIGHLEAASGVAGFIKTCLVLKNGIIPQLVGFSELNPNITNAETFIFPKELIHKNLKRAGVSSFGFGGSNAHIILEKFDFAQTRPTHLLDKNDQFPFILSGNSKNSIIKYAKKIASKIDFKDIERFKHQLLTRSLEFPLKAAFVFDDFIELSTKLNNINESKILKSLNKPKVIFVFPGQGSQWKGMGRDLFLSENVFRETLLQCSTFMNPILDIDLVNFIFDSDEDKWDIDTIQPMLFAIEVSLAKLWLSKGVMPDAVVGHSMGEIAAAYISGLLSLEDAVNVICIRSKTLLKIANQGSMALVSLSEEKVLLEIRDFLGVEIAVSNSPDSTVISGNCESIDEIVSILTKKEIFAKKINVNIASHGPMVNPVLGELAELLQGIKGISAENTIPMFSTVIQKKLQTSDINANYFCQNLRSPVQFYKTLDAVINNENAVVIEISPHPILKSSINWFSESKVYVLESLIKGKNSKSVFDDSLEKYFSANAGFYKSQAHKMISFPLFGMEWEGPVLWDDSIKRSIPRTINNLLYREIWQEIKIENYKFQSTIIDCRKHYEQIDLNILICLLEKAANQPVFDTTYIFSLKQLQNPYISSYVKFLENLNLEGKKFRNFIFITDSVEEFPKIPQVNDSLVKLENGKYYVKRLIHYTTDLLSYNFRDKKILFVGGNKGIGLGLIKILTTDHFPSSINCIGRSDLEPEVDRLFREKNVTYTKADITNYQEIQNLGLDFSKFDLIFNLAGIESYQDIHNNSQTVIKMILEPKIKGLNNILELINNNQNTRILNFSSAATKWGSKGLSTYSCANFFQESISDSKVLSVAWGRWGEVGISTAQEISRKLEDIGMLEFSIQEAFCIISHTLQSGDNNLVCARLNWDYFVDNFSDSLKKNYFDLIPESHKPQKSNTVVNIRNFSHSEVFDFLKVEISKIIGVNISDLDNDVGFKDLGLDSLMVLRLKTKVEEFLNKKIKISLMYKFSSISALAQFLSFGELESEIENHVVSNEKIAIVGLALNFPGASSPKEFWQNIISNVNSISENHNRWNTEQFQRSMTTQKAGYLEDIKSFAPSFFGITPKEAISLDPQQRLVLETCYHAFENTNRPLSFYSGKSVGVFIGAGQSGYANIREQSEELDSFFLSGNSTNVVAGRVSYIFNLQGPSLTLDTACSSSLVAIHYASNSLLNHECDFAVAGGVSLIIDPQGTISVTKSQMLAPDGLCKVFDNSADGFVRGEGVGIVILKRLSDSLRDGDKIHAVIEATGINHGGRSQGLTVPNVLSQENLFKSVLKKAKLSHQDVGYIEAHGTGTKLGDPIEAESIFSIYGDKRMHPIAISSVKSQIGHLEAASGVAGLIKAVLALKNKKIPGNSNLKKLNEHIDLPENCFIHQFALPWQSNGKPRIAGVNSFGFSGTNCHILLSENNFQDLEEDVFSNTSEQTLKVFPFSAKTKEELILNLISFKQFVEGVQGSFTKIAKTLQSKFSDLGVTKIFFVENKEDLFNEINNFLENSFISSRHLTSKKIIVFPGQGIASEEMLNAIFEVDIFKKNFINICEIWKNKTGIDLNNLLIDTSLLKNTRFSQILSFVYQISCYEFLKLNGIEGDFFIGHSAGEISALFCNGLINLEQSIDLINLRSRIQHKFCNQGKMVAVQITQDVAEKVLKSHPNICIAARNGVDSYVFSGKNEDIRSLLLSLVDLKCKVINENYYFHHWDLSHDLDLVYFERLIQKIEASSQFISTTAGKRIEYIDGEYFVQNLTQKVNFYEALLTLEDDLDVIEISPLPVLSTDIVKSLKSCTSYISTGVRNTSHYAQLKNVLERFYTKMGCFPPSELLDDLPGYIWNKNIFWWPSSINSSERILLQEIEVENFVQDLTNEESDLKVDSVDTLKSIVSTITNSPSEKIKISWEPLSINSRILLEFQEIIRVLKDVPKEIELIINFSDEGKYLIPLYQTNYSLKSENHNIFVKLKSQSNTISKTIKVKELSIPYEFKKFSSCDQDKYHVIIGGLSGVSEFVSKWLFYKGAENILLIGRKCISPEVTKKINSFWGDFKTVKYITINTANSEDFFNCLKDYKIAGFINTAGYVNDELFINQEKIEIEKILESKIDVINSVIEFIKIKKCDYFINFSSIASLVGGKGQLSYAYANAFQNNVIKDIPELRVKSSICFGPLSGDGMLHANPNALKILTMMGLNLLSSSEIISALEYAYNSGKTEFGIFSGDFKKYIRFNSYLSHFPEFKEFYTPDSLSHNNSDGIHVNFLSALSIISGIPIETIDLSKSLSGLGLDSILILDFKNLLERQFNIYFSLQELVTCSSLNELLFVRSSSSEEQGWEEEII